MNATYKDLLQEIGKCELCGSKRNLEVHHIVPRVCGINGVDIDDTDNLIVLCGACHAHLTPKSYLTKYGLHKRMNRNNASVMRFFRMVEEQEPIRVSEVIEIFNEWAGI